MEFSIDIHTSLDGKITIEDFSKEYNLYLDENVEVINSYDYYKYSESATLNTIIKVGTKTATLIDVLLNEHKDDLDSCTFLVKEDGYYVVDHLIIPNLTWLENASDEYLEYYETLYVTDGKKLYKVIDGELEECTVKEVLERNIEGTTIKKCKVEVFYTGSLLSCYINYCKDLFNNLLGICNKNQHDDKIFARDFLWMTLNIIDYLIGFKQFMEAQRILESFKQCGGFCNNYKDFKEYKSILGCGCSKTTSY